MNENEIKKILQKEGLNELDSERVIYDCEQDLLLGDDADKYSDYKLYIENKNA